MLWCPILPERRAKFEMIMRALASGWPNARAIYGEPPDDDNPVACYGQVWGTEKILTRACETGRDFWHIDNGFWKPGRGDPRGYYRFSYCGMTARFLPNAPADRFDLLHIDIKPWRESGRHILFALPGLEYGCGLGLDMPSWISATEEELREQTDRPIVVRDRKSRKPLVDDLRNCWAVVTHSSNVAVDAVVAGIPVFVSSLSMAAPVGNMELIDLECPKMPDRIAWARSLACQQFTVEEMGNGIAYNFCYWVEHAAHS